MVLPAPVHARLCGAESLRNRREAVGIFSGVEGDWSLGELLVQRQTIKGLKSDWVRGWPAAVLGVRVASCCPGCESG